MATLEAQPVEKTSIEELLEGFGTIPKMPEKTLAEARAKLDAYNNAVRILDERIQHVHNESGNNSLDDDGQEESEDDRERNLISMALGQYRQGLAQMHDRIVELEAA